MIKKFTPIIGLASAAIFDRSLNNSDVSAVDDNNNVNINLAVNLDMPNADDSDMLPFPFDQEWHDWKTKHNQEFPTAAHENFRYQLFHENRKFVQAHNERFHNGGETYEVELNKFSHLTEDEIIDTLKHRMRKHKKSKSASDDMAYEWNCPLKFESDGSYLPAMISYSQGSGCYTNSNDDCFDMPILTTKVKQQLTCGGCYSFGTNVALEGHLCKTGRFNCTTWEGLSEQQIIDCSAENNKSLLPYTNFGCQGGYQENALRYIMKNNYQMNSFTDYPYVSGQTKKRESVCKFNSKTAIDKVFNNCGSFTPGDEHTMAQVVNEIGPLTVAIDASGKGIIHYKRGIFTNPKCGNTINDLDHAVAVTGYGVYPFGDPSGTKTWEVKNSWGTDWGQDGYILFERDNNNACGIATDPVYVV